MSGEIVVAEKPVPSPLKPNHDNNGKFCVGNKAWTERRPPKRMTIVGLRKAFEAALTYEDITEITQGLLDICKTAPKTSDRLRAIEILFLRIYGAYPKDITITARQEVPFAALSPQQIEVLENVLELTPEPQDISQEG